MIMCNDTILFFFGGFVKRNMKKYDILNVMIQDISPHRLDNGYPHNGQTDPLGVALFFSKDEVQLLQESDGALSLPCVRELALAKEDVSLQYLFLLDETPWYLVCTEKGQTNVFNKGIMSLSVQEIRRKKPFAQHETFALLTAYHLSRWYEENRYCGSCAAKTVPAQDERALDCPSCHRRIYPKIMPAVIVGVTNQDEIILTRYANRPIAYHALVAGFNEIGETLEDTVRREVMEEVGLKVTHIRYYKSQPWAVAGDILSGFFCDVEGDPTIRMDENELKEAVWVKREDVDMQPDHFSLTNEMMMVFREGREPKYTAGKEQT